MLRTSSHALTPLGRACAPSSEELDTPSQHDRSTERTLERPNYVFMTLTDASAPARQALAPPCREVDTPAQHDEPTAQAFTSAISVLLPLAQVVAPVSSVLIPLAQVVAPMNSVLIPLAQVVAPLSNVHATSAQVVAPMNSVLIPLAQVVAPLSNVLAPSAQALAPMNSVLIPLAQAVAPLSNVLATSAQVVAPMNSVLIPLAQVVAPLSNVLATSAQAVAPMTLCISSGASSCADDSVHILRRKCSLPGEIVQSLGGLSSSPAATQTRRRTLGPAPSGHHHPNRVTPKLGDRRFGAEEAPKKPGHRWAVSRQAIEPGQRGPPSQPETRVPLRPDAIDRKVRSADRAPPPLCTETPVAERAPTAFGVNRVSLSRHARQDDHRVPHGRRVSRIRIGMALITAENDDVAGRKGP